MTAAERVRAGVTAHAAFGDPKGADLAVAAAPLVPIEELGAVVAEVALIDRALVHDFASAAAPAGSTGPDDRGHQRADVVAGVLSSLGHAGPTAQMENAAALSEDGPPAPQLAFLAADR